MVITVVTTQLNGQIDEHDEQRRAELRQKARDGDDMRNKMDQYAADRQTAHVAHLQKCAISKADRQGQVRVLSCAE